MLQLGDNIITSAMWSGEEDLMVVRERISLVGMEDKQEAAE